MRLKNIQLWKIDNYNLNLYNIFKWYLNLKKLYLVFFSIYSLNKYRIIYIYYYKFKTFKKKRARSIFKRRDNAVRVLFTRHKLMKYKRKSLILAKYSFFKPKGTKNFIFKNFITNKKKHKNLLGHPNKILLTINFRNLLLIPGVRFKKTKSNTPGILFRKKILHKNLKKKLLDQKVSLFELKKKLLNKYKKKVIFLKRNRLKFYKWKKHKKFNQIKNNMYLYKKN